MTFEVLKKKVGDYIEVTDFVANGSFASLKANVQYLSGSSPEKFAVLVRTLDFNRNWNEDFVWVNESAFKFLKKSSLNEGDLVLCNVGSVGIVFEVPDLGTPMTLGPNSVLCRTKNPDEIRQRFLYYYFLSPAGQALLEELSGGSTVQPKFNKTVLRNSEIEVPDLPHQDFAIRILGGVDSKIAANNALSKTLEDIAQTIFKSWFIDFDPVKAKMAGEKPAGMDAATAALFPDSMYESEIGLVPKGWEILQSTDLFSVLSGGTPKTSNKAYWKGDIPWFSVVDAPDSEGCFFIKTTKTITKEGLDNSAAKLVRPGVTVISARGTVGKTAIVAIPSTFNQSCYGIEGKYGDFFTYLLLQNQIARLQNISHGGMFDTITRDTFSAIKVAKSQTEIMKNFESLVSPIFLEIRSLQFQSDNLASIRDFLLPRLISGELQIPEEMLAS
jgi:restriction endonuclease S subunit